MANKEVSSSLLKLASELERSKEEARQRREDRSRATAATAEPRRRIIFRSQQRRSFGYYFWEVVGIVLNFLTIAIVIQWYVIMKTSSWVYRNAKRYLYSLLGQILESDVFVDYYNRILHFLESHGPRPERIAEPELRRDPAAVPEPAGASNFQPAEKTEDDPEDIPPPPPPTVLVADAHTHDLQPAEETEDDLEDLPPPPTTPTVVIAEVHTHDTPTSEEGSPRYVRFRSTGNKDSNGQDTSNEAKPDESIENKDLEKGEDSPEDPSKDEARPGES